jgi:threonine synthase
MKVTCIKCGKPYPEQGVPFRCDRCGGLYDFRTIDPYQKSSETKYQGIWRHAENFYSSDQLIPITLGEGDTPLLWSVADSRNVAFKCEYLNPTGSFKDRGSAVITGFLASRGILEVVEDSSGNAGASLSAYAARAGIIAKIFTPETASGPKMQQITAYGAELIKIPGARSKAAEAVLVEANRGTVYASHAYLPFNLAGYATLAYELVEQLGNAPGSVLCPVGQGGLLLGMGRGFVALKRAGLISRMPQMIGIQARACAPLWAASTFGSVEKQNSVEGDTIAEGIRVSTPVRSKEILEFIDHYGGFLAAVDEDKILYGRDELALRGFYVETTSAVVWHILVTYGSSLLDPIVVILTGSGLKNVN